MGSLIDSSVLIAAERGRLDFAEFLKRYDDDDPLAHAAITASGLLHGVHRAADQSRRDAREAFVEGLLAKFPILSFDLGVARFHAKVSAELATQGLTVGAHDLLIASTALASGFRVITRHVRSFPRIPGLLVETI